MVYFAAVQMTTKANLEENINKAKALIRQSAQAGAKVVAIPETFNYIGSENPQVDYKLTLDCKIIESFKDLSKTLGIYLLCGSFQERIPNNQKSYNTALFISPEGQILSIYRKIHLFDIDAPTVTLKESDNFEFGDKDQQDIIETPYGKLATTICYDLRFPELYRRLALNGAQIIFVPAAFTMQTGKEHWEILLRARAIENEVYIIAPNQFGTHNSKRQSYGNSMIIDPWGKVLARASDKECFIMAEVDLNYQEQVRQNLPCLQHKRL